MIRTDPTVAAPSAALGERDIEHLCNELASIARTSSGTGLHAAITARVRQTIIATPPAAAPAKQAVFAILFDDRDRSPEIVVGEAAACARFENVSLSWNAHLFGKIMSNSRDDVHAQDNITLAAPEAPAVAASASDAQRLAFMAQPGALRMVEEEKGLYRVYQDLAEPECEQHRWCAMTLIWHASAGEAIDAAAIAQGVKQEGAGQ